MGLECLWPFPEVTLPRVVSSNLWNIREKLKQLENLLGTKSFSLNLRALLITVVKEMLLMFQHFSLHNKTMRLCRHPKILLDRKGKVQFQKSLFTTKLTTEGSEETEKIKNLLF